MKFTADAAGMVGAVSMCVVTPLLVTTFSRVKACVLSRTSAVGSLRPW